MIYKKDIPPTKFSNSIKNRYTRYGCYKAIEDFLSNLDLKPGSCLLVGDTCDDPDLNFRFQTSTAPILINMLPDNTSITAPSFPDVDMHNMPYEQDSFDYILADNVIEHVRKPWVCLEEARRVLKPGGIGIFITGLMTPVHGEPHDYFRFTLEGLKVLCENYSQILTCGAVGSRELLNKLFVEGKNRVGVAQGGVPERMVIKCDNKQLITNWIIAR